MNLKRFGLIGVILIRWIHLILTRDTTGTALESPFNRFYTNRIMILNSKKIKIKIRKHMTTTQEYSKRRFIKMAGMGAAATAVLPAFAGSGLHTAEKRVRIDILGRRFGLTFQFHEHPHCRVEAVSDLRPDRCEKLMQTYRWPKSYESLEKLLQDKNVDAVFIATGAPDHAPHVIASLKAGKHVLCTVPAASSVEEYEAPEWRKGQLLPEPLRHNSGHEGLHTFITHEFVDSIVRDRTPELDIYQALAFTVPGIVPRQSALKGSELLKIPGFVEE